MSAQFQGGQRDDRAQHAQDEEPHHHLRFVPAFFFKMMVQRRHQKNPLPGAGAEAREFKPAFLHNHRHRFRHKHATRDHQQKRLMHQHRHDAKRAAERERSCVAHEHLRRMTVEPQKTKARASSAAQKTVSSPAPAT